METQLSYPEKLRARLENRLPADGSVRLENDKLTVAVYNGGTTPKRVPLEEMVQRVDGIGDSSLYSHS